MASNSCREPFKDVLRCLRHTACFQEEGKPLSECAQDPQAMQQCSTEHERYKQCRQGLLDPRNRLRGNKALR